MTEIPVPFQGQDQVLFLNKWSGFCIINVVMCPAYENASFAPVIRRERAKSVAFCSKRVGYHGILICECPLHTCFELLTVRLKFKELDFVYVSRTHTEWKGLVSCYHRCYTPSDNKCWNRWRSHVCYLQNALFSWCLSSPQTGQVTLKNVWKALPGSELYVWVTKGLKGKKPLLPRHCKLSGHSVNGILLPWCEQGIGCILSSYIKINVYGHFILRQRWVKISY